MKLAPAVVLAWLMLIKFILIILCVHVCMILWIISLLGNKCICYCRSFIIHIKRLRKYMRSVDRWIWHGSTPKYACTFWIGIVFITVARYSAFIHHRRAHRNITLSPNMMMESRISTSIIYMYCRLHTRCPRMTDSGCTLLQCCQWSTNPTKSMPAAARCDLRCHCIEFIEDLLFDLMWWTCLIINSTP